MGMPKIKCKNIDKCCAASSILQSIALQEAGLAHIINAEGEKLQKVISMECVDVDDLLAVNKSVENMIDKITALEIILRDKLKSVIPLLEDCKENPRPPKKSKHCN